jgi:adenylate cyclase class 2
METEAKLQLKSPFKLRDQLRAAGASFEGRVLEKNWLYDRRERTFTSADKLLRLREDRRLTLTFKGPRQDSEFKKREEIELEFPSGSPAHSLLDAVGLVQWLYYEKVRETWRLGAAEIVIDELPDLGLFVEVEAPTEAEIDGIVRTLKLPRRYVNSTYVEMLVEQGKRMGRYSREFKFSPDHKFLLSDKQ